MDSPFIIVFILFYGLLAVLCFYAGYSKWREYRKYQQKRELKNSFKLIDGEKNDSKN